MKCHECGGTGIDDDRLTCYECGETGKVEMTEQEYIQTCNTEQLAEFLYDIRYDYQVPWKNKGVVEWLKQPHKEE